MKKLLLFVVSIVTLVSCECPYAWKSDYPNPGDTFLAEYLYGTWQSSDLMFGTYEVKEFVMSRSTPGLANVHLGKRYSTERWNATYCYKLDGKFLYFKPYGEELWEHKFKILEFDPRDIILQNCFGSGEKATISFVNACSGF